MSVTLFVCGHIRCAFTCCGVMWCAAALPPGAPSSGVLWGCNLLRSKSTPVVPVRNVAGPTHAHAHPLSACPVAFKPARRHLQRAGASWQQQRLRRRRRRREARPRRRRRRRGTTEASRLRPSAAGPHGGTACPAAAARWRSARRAAPAAAPAPSPRRRQWARPQSPRRNPSRE